MGTQVPKEVWRLMTYLVGLICYFGTYFLGVIYASPYMSKPAIILHAGLFILGVYAYRAALIHKDPPHE